MVPPAGFNDETVQAMNDSHDPKRSLIETPLAPPASPAPPALSGVEGSGVEGSEVEESIIEDMLTEGAPAEEDSFEALFAANPMVPAEQSHQVGATVSATVTRITEEAAFVDYGAKSEGVVFRNEITDDEGNIDLSVGETLDLRIVSMGSEGVVLSRGMRLRGGQEALDAIQDAWHAGVPIEARVAGTNKGGFDVEIGAVRAFCPISQIDARYCEDPQTMVGLKDRFEITEFAEGGRRIVVSRRKVLEAEAREKAEQLMETLKDGAVVSGRVSKLMDFGAFIDLGGVEGLVHVSEISLARVDNPAEKLSAGDEVKVKVKSIEEREGKLRISLSMKALEADPWADGLPFAEGATLTGRVARLQPFGAFIELIPGVDGLVHVSEICFERIPHPSQVLTEGQTVDVRVMGVDLERRRVSLSIKDLQREARDGGITEAEEWMDPAVGQVIEGVVDGIKPYGLFVRLPSAGPRVRGLLHREEMGTGPGSDLRREFPEGTRMNVEIVAIDEQGRIRLSMKSIANREERKVVEDFNKSSGKPRGDRGSKPGGGMGSFGKLLAAKLKG